MKTTKYNFFYITSFLTANLALNNENPLFHLTKTLTVRVQSFESKIAWPCYYHSFYFNRQNNRKSNSCNPSCNDEVLFEYDTRILIDYFKKWSFDNRISLNWRLSISFYWKMNKLYLIYLYDRNNSVIWKKSIHNF